MGPRRASVPSHPNAAGTFGLGVPAGRCDRPFGVAEHQDDLSPKRGALQTDLLQELIGVALGGPADRKQLLEITGSTTAGFEAVFPVR